MKFESNKKDVMNTLNKAEDRTLKAIGEFVEGQAKLLAPVGQYESGQVGGNLRGSITYKVDEKEKSVVVGTNVEYAPFVEYGTGRTGAASGIDVPSDWKYGDGTGIKPQPYLTPAAERNQEKIQAITERLMRID